MERLVDPAPPESKLTKTGHPVAGGPKTTRAAPAAHLPPLRRPGVRRRRGGLTRIAVGWRKLMPELGPLKQTRVEGGGFPTKVRNLSQDPSTDFDPTVVCPFRWPPTPKTGKKSSRRRTRSVTNRITVRSD